MSNPSLPPCTREALVKALMDARRAIGMAMKTGDVSSERASRNTVDRVKRELGERGPVWWKDGAPDYNRHMARNTPYAQWYACHTPD